MADSYTFTSEDKQTSRVQRRNPLKEIPQYKISSATPEVYDSLDIQDHYDVAYGQDWITDLNPQQALIVLRRSRAMYLSEINKIQREIDRITLLEMPHDDPRAGTEWPRQYNLRVKKEIRL